MTSEIGLILINACLCDLIACSRSDSPYKWKGMPETWQREKRGQGHKLYYYRDCCCIATVRQIESSGKRVFNKNMLLKTVLNYK